MSEAPRLVDYLDADVARALPVPFPMWIAEESCRRVSDLAKELPPERAEELLERTTAFLDEMLIALRLEMLPFELEPCVFLDPGERLHLIGTRRGNKIRVDEDLNVALVRAEPLKLEGARAAAVRAELRELFSFAFGSADKKPVAAIRAVDLSREGEPGAFFLELDAPSGGAYLGRFDRLRAYSDGKVMLARFRPISFEDDAIAGRDAGAGMLGAGAPGAAGGVAVASGAGTDSDSPFDRPGWAVKVAPVIPS